jgi:hypothetical protein
MSVESMDTSPGTATAGTPTDVTTTATEGTAQAGTPSEPAVTPNLKSDTSGQTQDVGESQQSSGTKVGETTEPEGFERPANPWESDENTYKKRYNDALPHLQRTFQEKQQLEQRYQDTQKQLLELRKQEAERSEKMQLKDWHPRSPNYQQTKAVFDKVGNYIKAKSALPQEVQTPEVLRGIAEQFGVTAEDVKVYQKVEYDRQQTQEQLLADPETFIVNRVESLITAKLQEFDQFNMAKQSAQSFLNDPKIRPLIDKYAPDMDRMMDPGVPGREKALLVAQLKAENEALKSKLGSGAIETAQAEARQALRQSGPQGKTPRGSAGKDSVIADPVAHFKAKGLKGHDLAMAIARYNSNQQS